MTLLLYLLSDGIIGSPPPHPAEIGFRFCLRLRFRVSRR
jgi:hypothetical protein